MAEWGLARQRRAKSDWVGRGGTRQRMLETEGMVSAKTNLKDLRRTTVQLPGYFRQLFQCPGSMPFDHPVILGKPLSQISYLGIPSPQFIFSLPFLVLLSSLFSFLLKRACLCYVFLSNSAFTFPTDIPPLFGPLSIPGLRQGQRRGRMLPSLVLSSHSQTRSNSHSA